MFNHIFFNTLLYFDLNHIDCDSSVCIWQYIIIDSGNGLAPNHCLNQWWLISIMYHSITKWAVLKWLDNIWPFFQRPYTIFMNVRWAIFPIPDRNRFQPVWPIIGLDVSFCFTRSHQTDIQELNPAHCELWKDISAKKKLLIYLTVKVYVNWFSFILKYVY